MMRAFGYLFGAALFAATAVSIAPTQAGVSLGVDFPSGAIDYGVSTWNLGWSFTANADVTVVGLGNWAGGASFPQDQQVGLWNSSGTLLASVFVSNSSSLVGTAPWLFAAITPVELIAGQTYIVGAQGGADYTGEVTDATYDPRISFINDLYTYIGGPSNSPLVEPTSTEGFGASKSGWFGGNIELSASTIPEPSTWTMMLLGFAGVGFAASRRRRMVAAS